MPEKDTKLVAVGRVLKARGLKGELKMEPISNISDRFETMDNVVIEFSDRSTKEYAVDYAKPMGQLFRLKLAGVDDRTAADQFHGVYVLVYMDNLAPLEDDTYYVFDLEGLDVFDPAGQRVGNIVRIDSYPASEVLIVSGEQGEIMIPAVKEYILDVDIEGKKITVDLQKGLPFSSDSGSVQ